MSGTEFMPGQERIDLTKVAVAEDVVANGHQNGAVSQPEPVEPPPVDRNELRSEIQRHLELMGLDRHHPADVLSKAAIRHIHRFHREAVQ